MKNKIIVFLLIVNIILIGLVYNLPNSNRRLAMQSQVLKEMDFTDREEELNNKITELNDSATEYATYVQKCKEQIASAITSKGIDTSESDTIDVMVENIKKISESSLMGSFRLSEYSGPSYIDIDVNGFTEIALLGVASTAGTSYLYGYDSAGTQSTIATYSSSSNSTFSDMYDVSSYSKIRICGSTSGGARTSGTFVIMSSPSSLGISFRLAEYSGPAFVDIFCSSFSKMQFSAVSSTGTGTLSAYEWSGSQTLTSVGTSSVSVEHDISAYERIRVTGSTSGGANTTGSITFD